MKFVRWWIISCKQSLFQHLSGTEGKKVWKQTKMRRKTSLCLFLSQSLTPAMGKRRVCKGKEGEVPPPARGLSLWFSSPRQQACSPTILCFVWGAWVCVSVLQIWFTCTDIQSHAKSLPITSHMILMFISKTHSLLKLNPNISKLPWTKCHDKIVLP